MHNGTIYIPQSIYEDSLESIDYIEIVKVGTENYYTFSCDKYNEIMKLRTTINMCDWYENCNIPMAKSIFVEIANNDKYLEDIENVFTNNPNYKFVKSCFMSPKDIRNPPIFESSKDLIDVLNRSSRTRDWKSQCHLVFREVRNYIYTARCFWYRDKLTAVTCDYNNIYEPNNIKENIISFFSNHLIPYHNCVVDIGILETGIELIEINCFGSDLPVSARMFDWKEDYAQLHGLLDKVEFRFEV